MSDRPNLGKNTLYLTFASIAQKVISFVYFTLIARELGEEGTGAYFLALAITSIIAAFADLGLTSVLVREIAKNAERAAEWTKNILAAKYIAIPFTLCIAFFLPNIAGYESIALLIRIAAFVMVADMISGTFYGVLRGLHSLKFEAIGIFIGQSLTASIGGILLYTHQATLPLLILALLLGSSWNAFFSAYHVWKKLGIHALIPSFSLGSRPIKLASAFFLAGVFVKLYSYIDSITLSKVLGDSAVGIYAVSYKLTYAFQFLPLAFVAALYPTMSSYAHDKIRLRAVIMDAFWYLSLLGFPIVFGIWSLAPEIIFSFYGSNYNDSVIPLQILIFVLIPIFLDFPIGSFLNATDRQMTKAILMGLTVIVNLVANLLLIPAYGVIGASIASVISFTFLFIAGWFTAKPLISLRETEFLKRIGGLAFAAIVMSLTVVVLKSFMSFILTIPLGAIVYFTIAFLTGSLKQEHFTIFKRLIWKKSYEESPPTNA